ncbi:MAG: hypothetical protein MJ237_08380 [bacterium]|nr:hypothetical protein [bacterium]
MFKAEITLIQLLLELDEMEPKERAEYEPVINKMMAWAMRISESQTLLVAV